MCLVARFETLVCIIIYEVQHALFFGIVFA